MTPFQQVRMWWLRATGGQKASTTLAAALAIAVLAWLVTPPSSAPQTTLGAAPGSEGGTTGVSTGTTGGSTAASTGTTGLVASLGTGTGTTGPVTAGTSGAAGGSTRPRTSGATGGAPAAGSIGATVPAARACPPGAANQGVSGTTVQIAATILNASGAIGNSTLGVPSAADQQKEWQAVADTIAKAGGFGCRKAQMHFYSVNPLDSSGAQQQCLAIANDKPFAVMDIGALGASGAGDCLPQHKITFISTYNTGPQITTYRPYDISPTGLSTDVLKTGLLAFSKEGYFTAKRGFNKIGILYDDCVPDYYNSARAALKQAGLPDSQIVSYNYGCPSGLNSPADDEQAVITFKREGVTHVTEAGDPLFIGFTRVAQQQGFKPQYVLADPAVSSPNPNICSAADCDNIDGAVNMTNGRAGEESTPAYQPSAATRQCDMIMKKAGLGPVYTQTDGFGGIVCAYMYFLKAALDNAPAIQRESLPSGMNSIGRNFDPSYPMGPTDFASAPQAGGYGMSYWRTDQFSKACKCWRVTDRTFHASLA